MSQGRVGPGPGPMPRARPWVRPALRLRFGRSGASLRRSPLARRIVAYNLVALALLVAGVLHLDPFRDGLVVQRERAIVTEAQLIAAAVEARLAARPPASRPAAGPAALSDALRGLALPEGVDVQVFNPEGALVATSAGPAAPRLAQIDLRPGLVPEPDLDPGPGSGTPRGLAIADALDALRRVLPQAAPAAEEPSAGPAAAMAGEALAGGVRAEVMPGSDAGGGTVFRVAAPLERDGRPAGALVLTSSGGVIDDLARAEREAVLRLFALAIALSIGLGLALASTIAGPLSDLAHAAEAGHGGATAKVRIPDLTARRDEIGRLSGALRGLVAALVERVDAEERFAADVAHEIKNPLASLGSAVGALRLSRPDQREQLLGVIEHDLRRLDRLVSDISNASRLDSELVREAEAPVDLVPLLAGLAEHLALGARARGVSLSADLPPGPLVVRGLEARLAQVFVNLIDNAVSFCEPDGAVRIRARRRGARVVVAVEDTGPGIPEAALARVFERFYSERPEGQFGDNSGLGLAISRQIVEAHGGVIWAENIPGADAAPSDPPLGARLVVALPA